MKTIWKAMFALLMVIGASFSAQAEDKTITMGTMAWEDLSPISLITKKVLEDQGYTVKLTEFSEWGIAHAALGKGDIQLLVSQANYLAQDYWDRGKNRYEKISPVSHGLYQGIAVPSYVNVDTIEQLNENSAKFGDKVIGIEPGAGLMRSTSEAIKTYGVKLQLVEGSTAAMTAALKSAIDRKEWIAVTMWDPSWMTQRFDLKYLADPKGVYPPSQTYYWIGHKGFSEANPRAREAIASIFVPIADIKAINGDINDGKTVVEAVNIWISKHGDLIQRWENNKKN